MKYNFVKKMLNVTVIAALLISIAGCGSTTAESAGDNGAVAEAIDTVVDSTTALADETVEVSLGDRAVAIAEVAAGGNVSEASGVAKADGEADSAGKTDNNTSSTTAVSDEVSHDEAMDILAKYEAMDKPAVTGKYMPDDGAAAKSFSSSFAESQYYEANNTLNVSDDFYDDTLAITIAWVNGEISDAEYHSFWESADPNNAFGGAPQDDGNYALYEGN